MELSAETSGRHRAWRSCKRLAEKMKRPQMEALGVVACRDELESGHTREKDGLAAALGKYVN
jgi:hypothetical protein